MNVTAIRADRWHVWSRLALIATMCLAGPAGGCGSDEPQGGSTGTAVNADNGAAAEGREYICPQCQRHYFGGERFCMLDRTLLVPADQANTMQKVCPVCARKFPAGKNFCTFDGSPLETITPEMAAAGTPAAEPSAAPEAGTPTPKPVAVAVAPQPAESQPPPDPPRSEPKPPPPSIPRELPKKDNTPTAVVRSVESGHDVAVAQAPAPRREPERVSVPTRETSPPPAPKPTPEPLMVSKPQPKPGPAPEPPPPTIQKVASEPAPKPVTQSNQRVASIPPPEPAPKPVSPPASKPAAPVSGRSAAEILKDFDQVSEVASSGKLSAGDIAALERVPRADDDFTRSRALLAMNFKGRNNEAYFKALNDILSEPENQYNPVYNLELAEYYLLNKQYKESVDQTRIVDRYKQRFPREVYYPRVSRMYEVEAKALEGQFNLTEDVQYLDRAITTWRRYITHVRSKSDEAKVKVAEEYVTKLEKIKGRMQ